MWGGGEIVKTVKITLHGADHSTFIQGNIGTSNWGLNLLQEENVIPDIVAMAHHCEVLSIRGCVTSKLHWECCVWSYKYYKSVQLAVECSAFFPVSFRTCLYVLGLISKTKQGCELLKLQGWDAVRHSRRQQWPVVPDEVEQQPQPQPTLLSSVPSTLSLNSESTSSRHNSESDSTQPSKCFFNSFLTIRHTFKHIKHSDFLKVKVIHLWHYIRNPALFAIKPPKESLW